MKSGKKGAPPARVPLTRSRILRAAMDIADESGLDGLSMRRLAQGLGVEAMSLYNHVAGKEDLLDGMVECVVEEITVPQPEQNWREQMLLRAGSAYDTLQRHRWAPMLLVSRINVGPAMLRYIDSTHGCLLHAGFSHAQADHARHALDSHIYGFTLQEQHFPLAPEEYAEQAQAFLPMLPAADYPNLRALAEEVITRRYDGLHRFEFGLELILDGLEALLGSTPGRP